MGRVVRAAHALDGGFRSHALRKIEAIIRWFQTPRTGSLPFMRIAQPLALGFADLRGFARLYPDHRIRTGYVRKLELIDAGFGLIRGRCLRIEERGQVFAPANSLELRVGIFDAFVLELGGALLRSDRMLGDGGIALAERRGPGEYRAYLAHFSIAQSMDLL